MKLLVQTYPYISSEERNYFSVAYKHLIYLRRSVLNVLNRLENQEKLNKNQ